MIFHFSLAQTAQRMPNFPTFLDDHYHFRCQCALCSFELWTPEVGEIFLMNNELWGMGSAPGSMTIDTIRSIPQHEIENCEDYAIQFLRKFDRFHPVHETVYIHNMLLVLWNLFTSRFELPSKTS